jgi:ketosteroid isomerase-like protein
VTDATKDREILEGLNRDYISSVQNGATKRFGEILSEDFLNTNPDGTLVDKPGFLKQIAPPVKIRDLAIADVNIRLMGDFAIVHARTSYTFLDGRPGQGRYTDIYAKRNGRWLCVAAQVARS